MKLLRKLLLLLKEKKTPKIKLSLVNEYYLREEMDRYPDQKGNMWKLGEIE